MIKQTRVCDIKDRDHGGNVETYIENVIFDHDQEDGKSKCKPYFDKVQIEICDRCRDFQLEKRIYVYAYGAMGHNEYWLKTS